MAIGTNAARKRTIGGGASILLDGLRIAAALTVVVFHASGQWTTAYPAAHHQLGKWAHAAVVVFFVLSGYVIAFTTAAAARGGRQYALARLSRLYSVALPALLLTAVIEAVVARTDAALAARYISGHSGLRYGLSAIFCNEFGFFSAAPPLISPFWSLSFEFWYYLLFGLWVYCPAGPRKRWWLLGAGCLAGPKILLLLPIWLFGVLAYRLPKPNFLAAAPWVFVFLWLAVAGLVVSYLPALPDAVGAKPLYMAGQFLTDWAVGAVVALAIWCLPTEVPAPAQSLAWTKPLRTLADLSFPLYVLHFPLLVAVRAVFGWRANDLPQMGLATVLVCVVALALGRALESQRPAWRRLFSWLLDLRGNTRARPEPKRAK